MHGHDIVEIAAALILVGSGAVAIVLAARRTRSLAGRGGAVPPPDTSAPTQVRWTAAIAGSIGAGTIHLALAPDHFGQSTILGLGFVFAALFQLGWSALATRRHSRAMLLAGAAGTGALVGIWALSRTVGLPFGAEAWMPEPVGRADSIAIGLEVLTLASLTALGSGPERLLGAHRSASLAAVGTVPVVGLVAVATIVAISGPSTGMPAHPADGSVYGAQVTLAAGVGRRS
ncbi:MAG TPA: hypothetical protein VNL94_04660 [Candidatus Binatia bacterium]|nr:hypothetical protein [Candidatus Binatia bacterium]